MPLAIDGIEYVSLVAIGVAEIFTGLRHQIELVAGNVVAEPVARVLAEPQFACSRIDGAADAVANPDRPQFRIAVFRVDAPDLRCAAWRQALVARRPDRYVQLAVLANRDVFPAMRRIGREIVIDDLALPEAVKVILGVLPSINLVDVDDIERIVVERDAGRLAQALDDR